MSIASFAELYEASNTFVKSLFNLLKKIVKLQGLRKISCKCELIFATLSRLTPLKCLIGEKNSSIIEKYNSTITNIFPSKLYICTIHTS